jgi:hypothetical protein
MHSAGAGDSGGLEQHGADNGGKVPVRNFPQDEPEGLRNSGE